MNFQLTEENYIIYAIKHYDNPHCKGIDEFNDDMKRFRYIIRLFNKYKASGDLKERLIINHLVVIYNLFGAEAATKLLFFRIEKKFWPQLKTFLVFLNFMPPTEVDIPIDETVASVLRKI
jgi:hypothetical protein